MILTNCLPPPCLLGLLPSGQLQGKLDAPVKRSKLMLFCYCYWGRKVWGAACGCFESLCSITSWERLEKVLKMPFCDFLAEPMGCCFLFMGSGGLSRVEIKKRAE